MGIGQDVGHSIGQKTGSTGKRIIDTTPPVTGALFQDGFETGDFSHTENGIAWGSRNVSVSSTYAKTDTFSMRHRWGATSCPTGSNQEGDINLDQSYDELWVSYDLRIPANYIHRLCSGATNNHKGLFWVWGGPYNGGVTARTGPKVGFESRYEAGNSYGRFQMYVSAFIDGAYGPGNPYYGANFRPITANDLGEWMHMVHHVKMATSANFDGVLEVWKTDWEGVTTKLVDVQNGAWWHTYGTGEPYTDSPGFDVIRWWGAANSGYASQTDIYTDNIVVSTDPLPVP